MVSRLRRKIAQRLAEVEDFVDFLRVRDEENCYATAVAKASELSLAADWDNDEDASYDRM